MSKILKENYEKKLKEIDIEYYPNFIFNKTKLQIDRNIERNVEYMKFIKQSF